MSINLGPGISIPFIPKNNFKDVSPPLVTDDESSGFSKGSRWVHNGTHYVCTDATAGAAVWTATDNDGNLGVINELSDVNITSVTDNEILGYDSGTGNWINQTQAELGIDHGLLTGLADDDHTQYFNQTRLGDGTATALSVTGNIDAVDCTLTGDLVVQGLDIRHRVIHASSTGLHTGGVLSINAGDNTKFDITAGEGHVVDNFTDPDVATFTEVFWTAFTAVTVTGLATQSRTYIAIDSNGNITQQATAFAPDQFRDNIFIGLLDHPDNTVIDLVFPLGVLGFDHGAQLQDVILALGIVNTSGNVFSAASTNLTLARSAGELFRQGSNYDDTVAGRKNPNFSTSLADTLVSFRYRYQDGIGGWTESAGALTSITPALYDDGSGTLAAVANNKWSIQRIYYIDDTLPTTRILYGQFTYSSEFIAESAIAGEAVNIDPALLANYTLRGWLLVKGNATDLSDIATAKFITADKFGLATAGGGTTATTDLQTAYNNSPDPEVILSAAFGGLSIADASTPIGADLFEVQNFARTIDYFKVDTSGITVDGAITVTGLVDGRDVATDGTNQDTHIADSTIHFTEGSIDHGSIAGLADDDHTQYFNQTRMGDGTLTDINVSGQMSMGSTLGDRLYLYSTSYGFGIASATLYYSAPVTAVHEFRVDSVPYLEVSASGIDVTGTVTSSGNATFEGGTVTVGTAATAGKLILEGPSVNDLQLYTESTTAGVIDSAVDVWITIDNNNNQTTERFVVAQDGTGITGSPMFQILEGPTDGSDSVATFYGNLNANSGLDVTGNITVTGTVDSRDVATDGTKLDGIEALADVTDETNVTDALDGATLTAATVATDDKVLIQDTNDLSILKTVTAQSIADLAVGTSPGGSTTQIQYNNAGAFGGDSGFTTDGAGAINITGDLDVDNINVNANTVSTTNINGDLNLEPNGTGFVTSTKRAYISNTTEVTDIGDGSVATDGGIYCGKSMYSPSLISNNPWVFVGAYSGTLGSTDSIISSGAISGYKNYRICVRAESVGSGVCYVRVIINGALTATAYDSFYTLTNTDTTDGSGQGINIGGITASTTTDACGYWESDITAPNGTGGEFYVRNHHGFYYQQSAFGAIMHGGTWNQGTTADVTSLGIKAYTTINGDTAIASDLIDVYLWVYGSNLQSGVPWD